MRVFLLHPGGGNKTGRANVASAMTIPLLAALLSAVASGDAPSTGPSEDWMYLSAIGAATLLFTLVVALCVRRPR